MRVMVIVPAFATGKQRNPPAVARVVVRLKAARTPQVRRRIHKPCGMQADRDAEENSPQNHANRIHRPAEVPSAGKEQHAADDDGQPVILAHPHVEAVAGEVRRVARERLSLRVQRLAE